MAELVGEAFLSSFFQVILEKLSSNDFLDCFRRGKLHDMLLEKLDSTINSINQVLEEAETKQYRSTNVKIWLVYLRDVAYEVDQLLEEIAADGSLKKLEAESKTDTCSKVLGFSSTFTNPYESRIKELVEKLEFLAKQMDMLGLKQVICVSNEVSWKPLKTFPTTSLVDESSLYGRDGDKEEIIKFLLSDNGSGRRVPIISLVGSGGVGKTTLAHLVFNDHRVQQCFETKAWVSNSESFCDVGQDKSFLQSFQSSASGEELILLQQQLHKELTLKKYLLVVDDVLDRNGVLWERLLLPFIHGSCGSKIIVTTRDEEVASVMQSTQILHLKQLEESDCWSLFVKHAFHGNNLSEYPNLESIGKGIVGKSTGLPLAVKTLGSLLRRKFSEHEWYDILDTDMWHSSGGDNNINPVLRLCYHNIPSSLKRCFAYCSIFPKGYKFDKDQLIKLWMADGLLKCCRRTDKSEEELGNEFFDDLVSISFFQHSNWGSDVFLMHDLVNDLSKSVSGEFCVGIEGDMVQVIPKSTRHIWCCLDIENGGRKLEHICNIKGLRSLLLEEQGYGDLCVKISKQLQHNLFSRLKYLRMLSFFGCILPELADEISNLKLLRYLDLSSTEITS